MAASAGVILNGACGGGPSSYGLDPSGGTSTGTTPSTNTTTDEPNTPTGIPFNPNKPNVMLLVDRSGSMAEPADCGEASCPSKWDQLLALGAYLEEAKQMARLGLAVFPSPDSNGCSVSPSVLVSLSEADDVDERMMAAVQAIPPGGKTPVSAALDEVRRVGGLDDPSRDNILLVMTDGQPNCACDSGDLLCEKQTAVAAVKRLVEADPPVDVDIIGFGTSAQNAHETLTAMAVAAGDEHYYQSDTIEELIGTLYDVALDNIPCTFYLDEWPEPDKLVVHFDDALLEPCTTEPCTSGYTYDPTTGTVDFHGDTCDALRDGQQHNVWFDVAE
jgi:hypothetical protein